MTAITELSEKQQKRYHRILSLAEELFHERGFYKLSLSELTNELRVSRSTIYEHFGSKEGLVEAVVDSFTKRLDEGLAEVVNSELSTAQKFIAVAQIQGKNLNGKSDHRFLHDLRVHTPDLYAKFMQGRKGREQNGYRLLVEAGISEGLFDKSIPVDFLLQLYLKMGQMVGDTDLLENTSIGKEDAMEMIVKIFLNGTQKL